MKRYFLVASVLLVIDWLLGALQAAGLFPLWVFLALNFPFGLPYVWLESHWAGTHYFVGGQSINETWSFVAFFFSVFAQAWLYSRLIDFRDRNQRLGLVLDPHPEIQPAGARTT